MSGYTLDTQTAGAPPPPEIHCETERSIKKIDQWEIKIIDFLIVGQYKYKINNVESINS